MCSAGPGDRLLRGPGRLYLYCHQTTASFTGPSVRSEPPARPLMGSVSLMSKGHPGGGSVRGQCRKQIADVIMGDDVIDGALMPVGFGTPAGGVPRPTSGCGC